MENLDEWGQMIQKGFDIERSGDVIFMLQPGYLTKSIDEPKAHMGTSHGSAFNYDTHVPLLWYGVNIPTENSYRPIQIIDIAPTLIHLLNLQRTGAMTGVPIMEILEK
jgi:arylsulfatase A-like enzyme